jgi:hypothetical protein
MWSAVVSQSVSKQHIFLLKFHLAKYEVYGSVQKVKLLGTFWGKHYILKFICVFYDMEQKNKH